MLHIHTDTFTQLSTTSTGLGLSYLLKGTSAAVVEQRENVSHFPHPHSPAALEILMTRLHETPSLPVHTSQLNCMPLFGQFVIMPIPATLHLYQ